MLSNDAAKTHEDDDKNEHTVAGFDNMIDVITKGGEVHGDISMKLLNILTISLSMVVLNSRDRHEKTWRPTFTRLHNSPHNIYTFHEKTD